MARRERKRGRKRKRKKRGQGAPCYELMIHTSNPFRLNLWSFSHRRVDLRFFKTYGFSIWSIIGFIDELYPISLYMFVKIFRNIKLLFKFRPIFNQENN